PGPAMGAPAPDFTLKTVDGKGEITLSKQTGPKPVVLIFGNFTCGPFRGQAGNVEKLYRRYKARATFLMVYVPEAHPTDAWRVGGGKATAGWRPRAPNPRATRGASRWPRRAAVDSSWACPCWWTPSTTSSAPVTAACPAASISSTIAAGSPTRAGAARSDSSRP